MFVGRSLGNRSHPFECCELRRQTRPQWRLEMSNQRRSGLERAAKTQNECDDNQQEQHGHRNDGDAKTP